MDNDIVEDGEVEVEGDVVEDNEVVEEEEGEEAEKEKKEKKSAVNKKVKKQLEQLYKQLEKVNKRINLKKNAHLFEEAARDPTEIGRLLKMVDKLKVQHQELIKAKKRAPVYRYMYPAMRTFMVEHKVWDEQPALRRLSKGKGVATKQMISAYVYGYLGKYCEKINGHTYDIDENMQGLVKELLGKDIERITFSTIPSLVSGALIAGVDPLGEDLIAYQPALEFFSTIRKRIPTKEEVEVEGGEEEEVENGEEDGQEVEEDEAE